jgi:hypothetical protein
MKSARSVRPVLFLEPAELLRSDETGSGGDCDGDDDDITFLSLILCLLVSLLSLKICGHSSTVYFLSTAESVDSPL